MEEKLLTPVDSIRFMKSSGWNFNKFWGGKVDVSIWLRANVSLGARMYLYLVYRDQENRHAVPIDRCLVFSGESILLNGRFSIRGRGSLNNMQLKLKYFGCEPSSIVIEELSMRPGERNKVRRRLPVAV